MSHAEKRRAPTLTFALVVGMLGCGPRPATPPPSEGFLVGAAGARLHYQVAGSGHDTVIVVHGGPGAGMNDIQPDLEPLAKNHVVVYYDQRGGGRSDLPADTSLLDARYFVADLEAVRAHFHLQPATLVAHSFGAIVVAAYAQAHPDRVGRIVLLGATGPSRAGAAAFYGAQPVAADTATARRQSEILTSLLDGSAPDPVAACREYERLTRQLATAAGTFAGWKGSTCEMPASAVRYYYRYTASLGPQGFGDWDFTTSLRTLAAPLLVIDGARDTAGLAMERAWARAVADGRLLVVPDAGRAAYAERPGVVFSAIDAFLSGRWPEAARAE